MWLNLISLFKNHSRFFFFVGAAVFGGIGIYAQTWQEEIIQKTILYQSIHHQEKIFVQTDRPSYFAGEDIWFSAFILNTGNQKLNTTEKVLYTELVSQDGSSLQKDIIKIDNGRAWGSISTNENLKSGTYFLIAFTNWMRNAGSDFYFYKQISIIAEKGEVETDSLINPIAVSPSYDSLSEKQLASQNLSIKFYPEGGNLIQDVNCKVAFEVLDESGRSVQTNGLIYNDLGEIVTPTSNSWRGKGFFMLNSQAGRDYFMQSESTGHAPVRVKIPSAKSNGLALAIRDDPQKQQIQVTVSKAGNLSNYNSVFLMGIQNGLPKTALIIDLTDKQEVNLVIDKAEYKTGIVQFTLFDSNKIPQAERLFYIKQPELLNLRIIEKTLPYSARMKAELTLMVSDQYDRPVKGSFAVSVTDATRVPEALYHSPDICEYISLISDLPDEQKMDTGFYANGSAEIMKSELLMLTNGWRRYNWDKVLADTLELPKYFEEPGVYVHGTVRTANRKEKIPKQARISMYTTGNNYEIFNEKLKNDSVFTFSLKDFEESQRVTIQTTDKKNKKKDYTLEIQTNYQKMPTDNYRKLAEKYISDTTAHQIIVNELVPVQKSIVTKQSARKLLADSDFENSDYFIPEVVVVGKEKKNPKEKTTHKYGSPDYSIGKERINQLQEEKPWYSGVMDLLTDAFPNLVYTPGGRFVVRGNIRHNIFVLVDGELVNFTDSQGWLHREFGVYTLDDLISLDPSVVTEVDLIYPEDSRAFRSLMLNTDLYTYTIDDYTTDGQTKMENDLAALINQSEQLITPGAILAVYTKEGAGLYSKTHYKGISNLIIHGYSLIKEFYSPDYSTRDNDSILNDFRNTLAWYPNIVTDTMGTAPISFYSSDASNTFRVEVNGISFNGNTGYLLYRSPKNLFSLEPLADTNNDTRYDTNLPAANGYILLPDSSAAFYALVSNLPTNWFTYTSSYGIFSTGNPAIRDSALIVINKPGYQDTQIFYGALIVKKVILDTVEFSEPDLTAMDVIRNYHKKETQNNKFRNSFFEGAYRELLYSGKELHQITDYGFVQKWPPLAEPTLRIETQINSGRQFSSINFEKVIPIRPHTRSADGIPIIDPVYGKLSFLNQILNNEYEFKLEGATTYQGRKMYRITFDQNDDATWALYEGELYIDAETFGLAWASWKISKKGFNYLMPDEYLSAGGDQKTFQLIEEHNEITRRYNGEIWLPVFAVSHVTFTQQGIQYTISKELAWQPISGKVKKFKIRKPDDMKRKVKLSKSPNYNPRTWRTEWLLPPGYDIEEQIKYLNNVVEFKP